MKNKQIEEIVKIICQYRTDDGKCTCNQYQFGVRKCADPCVYRDRAEQLVDAGYAPVVHGEWLRVSDDDQYGWERYCSVCNAEEFFFGNVLSAPFCWHCGAKMDGGKEE